MKLYFFLLLLKHTNPLKTSYETTHSIANNRHCGVGSGRNFAWGRSGYIHDLFNRCRRSCFVKHYCKTHFGVFNLAGNLSDFRFVFARYQCGDYFAC